MIRCAQTYQETFKVRFNGALGNLELKMSLLIAGRLD